VPVNLCSKYPFNFFLISVGAQLVDRVGIESKGDGARKAWHFLLSSMMIASPPFNLIE